MVLNKRKVYVVESLVENDFLIFSSKKRANEFIKEFDKRKHIFFEKSEQDELFIVNRNLF